MKAYYNEFEPYAAEWLRNLIAAGHITGGTVDDRSITEVKGNELAGYERCHFFAGIAGWELALELAGWPAGVEVWTGSPPCQPFSTAGKRKGTDDERHLFPVWFELIAERRPKFIFGEQVAAAIGHDWLDGVFTSLEEIGYTTGAVVLGAHSAGAPHIRQRLYWMAYALHDGARGKHRGLAGAGAGKEKTRDKSSFKVKCSSKAGGLAYPGRISNEPQGCELAGAAEGMRGETREQRVRLNPWDGCDLIPCADGKARRTQPGIFPLADGVPARVGKLRAAGNAIVPQCAAAFISAFMDTVS